MGSASYLEGSAPPTPPAGYVVFYAKTDSLLYMKNDAGVEVPIKPIGGGSGDLLSDGSVPLVADWDVGAFKVTAEQLESDIADGTAPFIVVSGTQVDNLLAEFAACAQSVYIDVRNQSGLTLTRGSPVYISGYHVGTDNIQVDLADANVEAEMPAIGLIMNDIPHAANGFVTANGILNNVDTSAWSTGDKLYVSDTVGTLQNSKPTGVTWIQKMGTALRIHATLGNIDISGANRSNDLPQLLLDNLWLGNASGVPIESTPAQVRTALNLEDGSTADQSDAEIKTAYENNADTNEFSDAEQTKLAGIEAAADVTDATNVGAAGAVMDADISEAEGFVRKTGAGAYEAIKSNLAAAVAPDANDDSASGYAISSKWIDTTADKAYICLDATATAAVWIEITQSGSGAVVTTKGDVFGFSTVNARIPVGTDGQHLEADSGEALGVKWATPAAGGGQVVKHKSANYTAVAGEIVFCDSSGGAFTVTLPVTPTGDDRVTVVDSTGSAGTNNITVARNGETILGVAADFVIDQNFGQADFSYEGVGSDWKHALSGLS